MLIGIDGRPFYGAQAGTGRYVAELCRVLDEELPEANFLVYGNRPMQLPVIGKRWQQRSDVSFLGSRLPASLWYFLMAGRLAARDGVDVFWGAANFLPLGLPAKIRAVLTVYDLVFRLYPQTMGWQHRLVYLLFYRHSLKRATFTASISQGTADRLSSMYRKASDMIVRPHAGEQFKTQEKATVEAALRKYGIDFPYFLSVSTLEPRKNLISLIDAVTQLSGEGLLGDVGLVLVGQQGWMNRALILQLDAARANGVRIVQTGYVDDDDLPALYAGARAVVMPSLYEGFGMPVLEAQCCGARVIASDTPEIREAGGETPLYIEPSVAGIRKGLLAMLASGQGAVEAMGRPKVGWIQEGRRFAGLFR